MGNITLEKKTVRVVGAAIVDKGMVLVAQRPHSGKAYKSLKWEFPGGKIEADETEEEAIKREIKEELACHIEVDALLPEIEHEYPDFILRLTICICHLADSVMPKCLEHKSIRWITCEQLHSLNWAGADARCYPVILDYLKAHNI